MDKIKKLLSSLQNRDSDPSVRIKILLVIAAAAVIVLAMPDLCTGCDKSESECQVSYADTEAYTEQLEQRLCEMISAVDGAGETRVMVTLQNGVEYIYASEDRTSHNTSESTNTNGSQSSEAKENSENSYIIIDGEKGEQALVRTELMPSVNGVVVICEGADDPETAERIMSVVTTALNISPKRVCITLLTKKQ